ncbi:MAG TPA: hypothetical protein VNQ80_07770 [Parapedobacter sp.]|uniref:hypothetical protein n=1 Tax=Parapedobacter sp. TaxID=1958893 RepID=UPI002B90FEF7|nr:hypothetical protein [Parapedobacter sp.]HWK57217.1 hypothetical protein [Parapedobacter sp.]
MQPKQKSLRLRVFAGPNGSGKSTIINAIRDKEVNGFPLDFGHYINADDIARHLREGLFDFSAFGVNFTKTDFDAFVEKSGLLNPSFTKKDFRASYSLSGTVFKAKLVRRIEQLAQVIARYLREALLERETRFSFETVFSHGSNLDIMRRAAEKGYKVYLYFVSTESAEINKYRVKLRVARGGHDVPDDKIESRYHRSLSLLADAAEIAYQAYFFDNSLDDKPFRLIAHFKVVDGKKVWDEPELHLPKWFEKYFVKQAK